MDDENYMSEQTKEIWRLRGIVKDLGCLIVVHFGNNQEEFVQIMEVEGEYQVQEKIDKMNRGYEVFNKKWVTQMEDGDLIGRWSNNEYKRIKKRTGKT